MRVLFPGERIKGALDTYEIESDPIPGGQAFSYFVRGSAGELLFLKQFLEPVAESPNAKDFLARQRLLLQRLQEIPEFVCKEKELFINEGIIYKVSERITGRTLEDELKQAETDPTIFTADVRRVNACVLVYTVAAVHDKGIAHLDLKPGNALVERKFIEATGEEKLVIRLIDFDAAIVEGAPRPHIILGTPAYFSPEHLRPERFGFPGKESDVFTLGIILYEILARQYPYSSLDDTERLERKAPYPRDIAPWITPTVAELMWRAISPVRAERPTALELHQALLEKREPVRVALVGAGRRIRFHRDMFMDRKQFRGIPFHEYLGSPQARIFKNASGWVISQSRNASNPTYVGTDRLEVDKPHPLREGDVIRVGRFEMRVEFEYE